jgi:hypothetical protein
MNKDAWNDLEDEPAPAGWKIALLLVAVFAAFAYVGAKDYEEELEKERARELRPVRLNCETAEECQARLAAGLPLWKEEGK